VASVALRGPSAALRFAQDDALVGQIGKRSRLWLLAPVEEAGGQEDQRDHEGELGVLERVKVEAHDAVHCPCHAACEP
jgi:hypothetical protein